MAHSDPIANGDGVKFEGGSAGVFNGIFDGPADLIEVDVAGDYFTETVGDADKRPGNILVAQTAGVQQGPVRSSLEALFDCITSHFKPFENR